jgi:periplasmic divalent cation tolerance protein
MTSSDTACMVLTTTPSRDEARSLAAALVENRLAACVQMLPVESVYSWQGAVQHDDEILLLIKTRRELYAPLEAFIKEAHSYDVPEIVQVPVEAGSESYLRWLADVTA